MFKFKMPTLPQRKPRLKSVRKHIKKVPAQLSQPNIQEKSTFSWRSVGRGMLMFSWAKHLLNWLIMVAGTMSELVFMVAALYLCINANVHKIVLLVIDEGVSKNLVNFATSAYVALPELILCLACITTLGHYRTWKYTGDRRAAIWAAMFGLPTFIFLALSFITLSCAVTSATFELPPFLVVLRADAGYLYAFSSLLYLRIGKEQETDRLQQKDGLYQQLLSKSRDLLSGLRRERDEIKAELAQLKSVISHQKKQNEELKNAINKSADSALQAYSQECIDWLNSGIKTATVEEINHYTGHSKRKVTYAMVNGKLQTATRNKELIVVSSLIEWLKENPPAVVRNTDPMFKIVGE